MGRALDNKRDEQPNINITKAQVVCVNDFVYVGPRNAIRDQSREESPRMGERIPVLGGLKEREMGQCR
jgi:hypothetical protein